ncbi:hypothetical protein BN946_scf184813.g6 [Trametes cinnabarina]|uniref:Uncharacterized protein n=1 Tax=Pycnoporus cinnabarinus TaxID=5643 RepID=A0A060SRF4_PYCCI|nr:hypothetical protein BN946_scf184813.g6 [Trametes cinnabarina]
MSDDSSYEQEIVADYPRLLVENYCIIASSGTYPTLFHVPNAVAQRNATRLEALLWFDFALTLTNEYQRIWKRKWTGITRTDDILVFLNYLAFSAFTCLRIYGVWGQDWRPLIFVLPLTLVKPIAGLIEVAHHTSVQAGPPYGCIYIYHVPDSVISTIHNIEGNNHSSRCYPNRADMDQNVRDQKGIHADGDAYSFGDTASTRWFVPLIARAENKAYMNGRAGTAYFLILLLIQVVTIISNRIGSSLTIWLVWPYFDQVLTVIFLSRFMLDLRGLYFAERGGSEDDTSLHMSDVKFQGFASGIVGNLGATLTTTLATDELHSPSTGCGRSETGSCPEVRYQWEWDDDMEAYCNDPFVAGMKTDSAVGERIAMAGLEQQHIIEPSSERDIESEQKPPERNQHNIQVNVDDPPIFPILTSSQQEETREEDSPV